MRRARQPCRYGQMRQFQGDSDAMGGFQLCLQPAATPASFALFSSMQVLRHRKRFRQLTLFEIHTTDVESFPDE